jgi:phytoene/squalene synthetase
MRSIEKICLDEAFKLVRREKAYLDLVIYMYLNSVIRPAKAKVFRAFYFFCRNVDDVMDGDRFIPGSRKDYGYKILAYMKGEQAEEVPEIVRLYDFALERMNGMRLQQGDDPKRDSINIIESILFDFERSKSGRLLTHSELEEYYSLVFGSAINLSLIIAGSKLRREDVPQAVYGQGHLLSIKHLHQDIPRGTINIPHEILDAAGFNGCVSYDEVVNSETVREWIREEAATYHEKARELRRLATNSDFGIKETCIPLSLNIARWANRLSAEYR